MNPASVVLAAGLGTRLRPLTDVLPKALCPVNNVPLIDHNLARARAWSDDVAVNVHHGRERFQEHLRGRVHLSIEERESLGTAGALGNLRSWIDGRDVLVVNADAWHQDGLTTLVHGWDARRPRLLVVEDPSRADFDGRWRYTGVCLLPAAIVAALPATPAGLYEEVFARTALDLCPSDQPFFDCGTPADYHAANMAASGGRNVIGPDARVDGTIEQCVLWPGTVVEKNEHLRRAIRAAPEVTVFV